MLSSDHQLLKQHLRHPSGGALTTLIEQFLPLVLSVARRITANDEAARDISQTVFLRLIKKAPNIPSTLPLTAWFHRETHSASVDHVRSEVRRQQREQTAASLNTMKITPDPWHQLAPEIDGAINELPENDRSLVLLRFYDNQTHPQIARKLGIKEDAARMRTTRALEKLRTILSNRGITTTSALLASALPSNAVSPAPASLASSIATSLPVLPAASGISTFLKVHFLTFSALAIGVAAVTTQQIKINSLESDRNSSSHPPTTALPSSRRSSKSSARSVTGDESDLLAIFANPDPAERLHLIQRYSIHLSIHRIPEALDLLRQKTPEWDSESKMLTHLLLTRWAKADPEAAFASLDITNFSLERGHSLSILAALASLNPQRAADWLTSPSNSQAFYPVIGHLLAGTITKEWARQDFGTALEWAHTLADQQKAGAYSGILGTIAATNPQKAASLALTLEPGEARDHVLGEIAGSWARHSPKEALAWTIQLNPEERDNPTAIALKSWAETDPANAARFLDQQSDPTHFELVASQWSRRDPAGATNWLAAKPRSTQRDSALAKTLWNWTTQQPEAASDWIQNQPNGPGKDQAIAGLAIAAVEFDPRTAIKWTQKISAPVLRNEITRRTFATWTNQDPETAHQWARENNFQSNE